MYFKITVLPGDGIGPEVCREAVRILEAVGNFHKVDFRFEEMPIGATAIRTTGSPLPDSTLEACLKSDAVFLGAVGSPDYDHLVPAKRPGRWIAETSQRTGRLCQSAPRQRHSLPSMTARR